MTHRQTDGCLSSVIVFVTQRLCWRRHTHTHPTCANVSASFSQWPPRCCRGSARVRRNLEPVNRAVHRYTHTHTPVLCETTHTCTQKHTSEVSKYSIVSSIIAGAFCAVRYDIYSDRRSIVFGAFCLPRCSRCSRLSCSTPQNRWRWLLDWWRLAAGLRLVADHARAYRDGISPHKHRMCVLGC